MSLKETILVLACLFVALPMIASAETCPSEEDVAPCRCLEYGALGLGIQCAEIDDTDIARVASGLRGKRVNSFTILHSKLDLIPYDVFKGVKVEDFSIEWTTLAALTDRGEAFLGLEDYLEKLSITHCVFKNEWDWSAVKRFKKLKHLTIIATIHLETIGTDAMKASVSSSLENFYFSQNNISFISDHAFDSYKDVRQLTLNHNEIKNVKRTMLPNPANVLRFLDLSFNQIEQFPKDMFTNMPNLESLSFSDNKILVLDEKTFSPVWEQLKSFYSHGNSFRCDCNMSWIPKNRNPNFFNGRCASPPELQGKELEKLTSKDFMCYV